MKGSAVKIKITRGQAKFAVTGIVGASVQTVISQIVRNNTDEPDSRTQKVKRSVGSLAITSVLTTHVKDKTDAIIDRVFDRIEPKPEPIAEIEPPKSESK